MAISCNQYIGFVIIGKLCLSMFSSLLTVLYVDVCHVCYQLPQVITCGLVVFLSKVLTNHVVHRDGSRGCLLPN